MAIVIFGIFIGLTYTLFGSEGLSKDLKGLFTNATEKSNDSLNVNKREKLLIDTVYIDAPNGFSMEKNITNNSIKLNSIGVGGGLAVPTQNFSKIGNTYEFRFRITLNSGTVDTLGGHVGMSDGGLVSVKINGVEQEMKDYYINNTWANGVPVNIEIGETLEVSVIFDKTKEDIYADSPIKIQPNRNYYVGYDKVKGFNYGYGKPYNVTVEDIEIIEYK